MLLSKSKSRLDGWWGVVQAGASYNQGSGEPPFSIKWDSKLDNCARNATISGASLSSRFSDASMRSESRLWCSPPSTHGPPLLAHQGKDPSFLDRHGFYARRRLQRLSRPPVAWPSRKGYDYQSRIMRHPSRSERACDAVLLCDGQPQRFGGKCLLEPGGRRTSSIACDSLSESGCRLVRDECRSKLCR